MSDEAPYTKTVLSLPMVVEFLRLAVDRPETNWQLFCRDMADAIEASLPSCPVIELTPEVREAIEVAVDVAFPSHDFFEQRADLKKAAAILRGLLR